MPEIRRPGARMSIGASLYLALLWIAAPILLVWWVAVPTETTDMDALANAEARRYLALRIAPILLAVGEATRAAAAMMMMTTGDARQRAVAHTGVAATAVLVGFAVVPGPVVGLLALFALMVRQAAAGALLKEPLAWGAAGGLLAFGIACEGMADAVTATFAIACALVATAELGHAWVTGRARASG